MQDIPRTPSEVLSRIDLWRRRSRPALDTQFVAPRTSTERALADIWSEVLGLHEVGVDDSFFSLGGDSLHMTQVASRVQEKLGIDISFDDFFANPTVSGVARAISEQLNCENRESQTREKSLNSSAATLLSIETKRDRVRGEYLPHRSDKKERALIEAVVIPTLGRPLGLRRCLTSLAVNLLHYGRKPRVVVIDGTLKTAEAEENREVVRQVHRDFGSSVMILGINDTRRLSNNLTKAGFEKEVVQFGLHGLGEQQLVSIGASRNLLLLATAGEFFLSIDDDTVCEFACAPDFRPKLASDTRQISTDDDPAEVWSYPDRESLMSDVELFQIDFVRSHEELIDWPATDSRESDQTSRGGSDQNPSQLQPRSCQVMTTANGVFGDCAWGSPSRYLFVSDSSFDRLTRSQRSYSTGLTSREMLRVSTSPTITRGADHWMSTAFAANNRSLLPPFMPVGRGEDVVFARLLKKIEPRAYFGHVPWAILHAPLESRRFWPGEVLRSAATTDLREMFCALIGGIVDSQNKGAASAIRNLGQALVEIANQPADDFRFLLWQYSRSAVKASMTLLEKRAKRFKGLGTPWEDDIRKYIDLVAASWTEPSAAIPAELLATGSITDATELSQKLVRLYGRFLSIWPDMVDIARDRKEEMIV